MLKKGNLHSTRVSFWHHVDAGVVIAKNRVAADDGIDASVADINAVLDLRVGAGVVLNEDAVFMAGEDAPGAAIVGQAVLDHDALGVVHSITDGADAGAGDGAARRIFDPEAFHNDVAGALEINPVGSVNVIRIDDHAGVGLESNGISGRPVLRKVPALAVTVSLATT